MRARGLYEAAAPLTYATRFHAERGPPEKEPVATRREDDPCVQVLRYQPFQRTPIDFLWPIERPGRSEGSVHAPAPTS